MPNKKNALGAVIVTAAIMGLSLPASADPISVTITTTASIPVDTWVDTVNVVAGIELAAGDASSHANASAVAPISIFPHLFSAGDSIDIGANTVTNSWAALAGFGFPYAYQSIYSGIVWEVAGTTLQRVVLAAGSTGLIGINISNIVADGFTLQATADLVAGANFTLDLTHVHADPGPVPVPEPATLPLLMAGLLGLIASRRRRLA